MRFLFLLLALMGSTTIESSAQALFNEPVIVKNYPGAPVRLLLLRTWLKGEVSGDWGTTCFDVHVTVLTKDSVNSISYEIGPKGESAYVVGKTFLANPGGTMTQCVPNDSTRDEKEFIIKLPFVENSSGRTIWTSKEYRKASREFLKFRKSLNHRKLSSCH